MSGKFRYLGGRKVPIVAPGAGLRATVVSDGEVGVIIVLKAASRSMVAGKHTKLLIGRDELPDKLHVFVREPIKRLLSAYQFFKRRPPINYKGVDTITWEQFVDYVLGGSKNPHWRPVSDIIELVGRPVIAHLFENLQEEYPLGELPYNNVSKQSYDVDLAYHARELKTMYAGDYALRAEAGS